MQTKDVQNLQKTKQIDTKQADEAVAKIERWNFKQYFFNMLKYAGDKRYPWPRVDFSLNGQLLFRLEVCDDDADTLELVLKYFGDQDLFAIGNVDNSDPKKCTFLVMPEDDNGDDEDVEMPKFKKCSLDKQFSFVLHDSDSPSKLCYAVSFEPLSVQTLDKVFGVVLSMFKRLEQNANDQSKQFANAAQWSVEKLFYDTLHDVAAVAIEVKSEQLEKPDPESTKHLSPEKIAALEAEWERINNETKEIVDLTSIVSSCQLHADIWQYNERHRLYTVGRQYENLAKLQQIGDAMHVPFRGAADELQKQIYIAEFLTKMIPIICVSIE